MRVSKFNNTTRVYVETDGKMELLTKDYALVINNNGSIDSIYDVCIADLINAYKALQSALAEELKDHTDQEIFKVCEAADISYNAIIPSVREVRKNA